MAFRLAFAFVLGAALAGGADPSALAQSAAAGPSATQNAKPDSAAAGHIVTRKQLADCKRQAKERKLTYRERRKFLRQCVAG